MKSIPPKNPHFFKPILSGFKNGVKIPVAFLAKYFRGQVPKLAILRRGDRSWRVKINGGMLADGWEKFAAENGLHVHDVVVFRHGGDKVFDVTVFDRSHCEREYPLPHGGCSVPQPSNNFFSEDLNQKSAPAVVEGFVPDLERAESKQHVSYPEHKRTSTSKDDHPFFVSTLHHYSLKLSHVNIPSDFARENGLWDRQCKMILRDLKQRLWWVELDCTRNRVSIKHGWDKFCGANGLVEGDTFVFKLIDNGVTPIAEVYVEAIAQGTTSTSSADHPHFVSTVKPYCLKKSFLYLPIKFARSNGLVAAGKREMILRDDKGRSWSIVLGRIGHNVALLRGWHAFQMANGLKEGDAYKFELIESGKKPIAKFHCTASTSSTDHPHFVSTIKPYCLKCTHLHLPIKFARSNGLEVAGKREMILRDDKGRSWSIVLGRIGHHVALLRGWDAFRMANGLKEGDEYKFELIEKGKKPIAKFHSGHISGQEI